MNVRVYKCALWYRTHRRRHRRRRGFVSSSFFCTVRRAARKERDGNMWNNQGR